MDVINRDWVKVLRLSEFQFNKLGLHKLEKVQKTSRAKGATGAKVSHKISRWSAPQNLDQKIQISKDP